MADTPKHSVSVAGIVVDDQDRVLVIQRRDNGHWEPPGGVLELEEAPEVGTRREVLEETGVVVEVESLSGVYKNVALGVVALVFRCRALSGVPSAQIETQRVEWRSLDSIEDEMHPAFAVRVRDALSGGVNVRSHDGVDLISH